MMTENILRRLFNGEIHPFEDIVPQTEKYRDTLQRVGKFKERLESEFSPAMLQLFREYQAAYLTVTMEELAATFAEGFRLGAQIILEVTKNSDIPLTGNVAVSFSGGNQDDNHNDLE